ncbi:MAG: type II secretion system F family protein, partial [Pseudomonadota bacterium]
MASQQYSYQAIDPQGITQKGQLAADSEQEVVSILQARKLVPVQVSMAAESGGGLNLDLSALSGRKVSNADLIDFTSGLCTLMETHVPLDRALMLLGGLTNKPVMQTLISDLRREVKEGKSLADALRTHPETFSRMYVNIVHAGEEGGILDKLLPRLEKFLKEADESRRTIISALTYPAVIGVVGIISVVLLLTFMVPMFATVFEDMGSEVPDAAAFLLSISNWLQSYGWTLLSIPLAIWYGWRQWGSTPERRLHRDTTLIKSPLLGTLLLQGESSRFCRTLGALLGS